jgi:hypothetical protein
MKSPLSAVIVLLYIFAAGVQAQESPSPITWTRIDANEDGFSIEAPDSFKYVREQTSGRFGEGRGQYLSDGLYLYAFVDRAKNARQYEIVEKFVQANGQPGSFDKVGGQQITRYEFEGSDGYYHTVILCKSETRSFAFHAVSRTPQDPSAIRFIKSIRFGPVSSDQPVPEAETKSETASNDLKLDLATLPSGPVERAGGTNPGSGYGPGSGSPKTGTSPLKILSKQKAQYTDLARFYNIMGTVNLRVTFMADNTIGAITTIKTLPFGLTDSAIAAARSMRFEAEIANGQPRASIRPVSFMFTIY